MAKLIKGGNVQNIITDGDVIVTSPSKIGKTLDEVLDEQQSDIDRLKSNVKYIYAYGGVGGSGSGGSGGSDEKNISVNIALGGQSYDKDKTIILDGKGKYVLYVKISNAGGKNLYVGYSINSLVTDKMMDYSMNGENKYTREIPINLNTNGEINIRIDDDEGNTLGYYSQKYIVDSDVFNVSLNFINSYGETYAYVSPYECHAGDPNRKNRHFKIDASIYLTNYTDVSVKCEIEGNKDIKNPIYEGSDMNVVLPIEGDDCKVFINGDEFLDDKHMGTYTFKATLSYTIDGRRIVREKTLQFTIIPYNLYINVRTLGNVLYDSIESLRGDIGSNGKPKRYITSGSSLMLYGKVFEGDIMSDKLLYPTSFEGFDMIVGENGEITWDSIMDGVPIVDILTEQEESKNGVSITFPKHGIKKITFSTKSMKGNTGDSGDGVYKFEKYVFVDEFKPICNWYNGERYNVFVDSYFRANQGDATYLDFPTLSSNKEVLNLTVLSNPVDISQSSWSTGISGNVCTIISLGIQVSNINSEDAKIIDIYQNDNTSEPKYTLRLNSLFGKDNDNKIAIPTEVLDKNDNKKYHLVQIIRTANLLENGVDVEYEDALYIDGIIESVHRNVSYTNLVVKRLVLNNINICYNLINIQYCDSIKDNIIDFNTDAYAYQYWLSYKEKYVNSQSDERLTDEEYKMINEIIPYISFDGTNVEVDAEVVSKIAQYSNLPTMMFSYDCVNSGDRYNDISSFMEMMWAGRSTGDTSFGKRKIDLYWIPAGSGGSLNEWMVKIPELTNNSDDTKITCNWEIDLQGTSTLRNRIKNYSLRINTGNNDNILFSPNFKKGEPSTFLPDIEWTIKADIADSAHANNTAIGKFVNSVCTKFDTKIPNITDDAKSFIKNALSGIPVLLYFRCKEGDDKEKIYYFGIYNFNLGRGSHYNLGYTGGIVDDNTRESDFMRVFNNIENDVDGKFYQDNLSGFAFAVGKDMLSDDVIVGEIQDNYPEFDFHQCQESLLFNKSENEEVATMFGPDSKITSLHTNDAKNALLSLVRSITKAGKYCFIKSGREGDFITSMVDSVISEDDENKAYDGSCVNRYEEYKIPDIDWQMTYENNKLVWIRDVEFSKNVSEVDLKKLITRYEVEDEENIPILNYTSASEYYTICMAFGMVDSVLKNMNLKNFQNRHTPQFYCAFYDMDCALEEDNSGEESVSYLAATDYWYSPVDSKTNKVSPVEKKNDYWDRVEGGQGFDFTSSYLLSVIKYAKSIFKNNHSEDLKNYPQQFWASIRRKGGALESADHFIGEYFKSGIMSTFEYLASLNYRVKYLYRGEVLDTNNNPMVKPLANASAFNGSRRVKVKNWLTKRLRFMDVMMNVNGLGILVANDNNIVVPSPDNTYKVDLLANPDITILHSAFDTDTQNKLYNSFSGEVEIYAPKNTPFICSTPGKNVLYLLPGGVDKPNLLRLDLNADINTRFYGSGMFTSVNKIETMFTEYMSIISDNIEQITYGGINIPPIGKGLKINCKSLREIDLNIPNLSGELSIDRNCISLRKINIANSGLYGTFKEFPNLQEVNISGLKADKQSISVSGSDFLSGENFKISGSDKDNKTTLNSLSISGVVGNFNCVNTNISSINIQNNTKLNGENFDSSKLSEFSISNDKALVELRLTGFKKVSITSCNNLETLSIDDALEEIYIDLSKLKDESKSSLKKISLGSVSVGYGSVNEIYINSDGNIIYNCEEIDDTITKKEIIYNKYNGIGIFDFTNYPKLKKVTIKNCDHLVHVKLPNNDIETDGMSGNPQLRWIDTGVLPAFRDNDNSGNDGYIEGKGDYVEFNFPIYSKGSKLILCSDKAFNNCPNYAMLRSDYDKSLEMIEEENYIAYTNIKVSDKCTSLANTFSVNTSIDDDKFNMTTAIRFIEKYVPDNVKAQITSLSGCFSGRRGVKYTMIDAGAERGLNESSYNNYHRHPILTNYTSLYDISNMYYNTGVNFISKFLLDLPYSKNKPENKLSWDNFIQGMNKINISDDAFYNISYRLSSYSGITFTIYEYDNIYKLAGRNDNNPFKICDFFFPFSYDNKSYSEEDGYIFTFGDSDSDSDGDIRPYESVTTIDSLNFGDQYIDFRGMFYLFPNVTHISSFLNGNLSKYNLCGLLRPCTSIISITRSFCDSSRTTQEIDLYDFFNWEENRKDIENLFDGNDNSNGFAIKKTISYQNLLTVIGCIEQYTKLKRLTNLFSYCRITDYNNGVIKFNKVLNNITNISNLFDSCTSDCILLNNDDGNTKGVYEGGVLNIGRPLFETLPKIEIAQRTFANTYLSSSLTYDFFCKRGNIMKGKDIFISPEEGVYEKATLYEYEYENSLTNLNECFYNVKFVNCKNWFDPIDNDAINRNYILLNDNETIITERGYKYYKYNSISGSYEEYILDNDIIDDCLDNYTDFISQNEIESVSGGDTIVWYNHDLLQDFKYYGNIIRGSKPFDPENTDNTIHKTYCCLPPDFLYGCLDDVNTKISGIFANSNITGVIPRNLTKKVKRQSLSNIFMNVNIMPNLEYYYDKNGGLDNLILDEIEDIVDIYDGSDSDSDNLNYCVVFRDEYGKLKKRKPVESDRNLGQFVYVPNNFTTIGNISNVFNFRYNLPKHWDMPNKFTKQDGTVVEYYKSTKDFNNAIISGELRKENLPYHTQYYFTTDKSIKWDILNNAKSVFISSNQDIDFSNKNTIGSSRSYCIRNGILTYTNTWTTDNRVETPSNWNNNVIEKFYVDLNLCGRKNDYNMLEDYGCPIVIKSRSVYLDNFVSGILTVFLNGRVFNESFEVSDLTTSNHKSNGSSYVIGYYGHGKNIILPKFTGTPNDDNFVFIPIQRDTIYYDFMVDDNDTMAKYNLYFGNDLSNIFKENKNKYTFK